MSTEQWLVVVLLVFTAGVLAGYGACKFDMEWQRLKRVDREARRR